MWFKKYLLPGFVFQSLVIGGGYGTGRELVEFFLTQGPLGGLLGMAVSTVIWSAVLAVSFELARMTRCYDYRTFIRSILGPGWVGYEVVYAIGLILVVSVLGSAAGELLHESFGLPEIAGIGLMMLAVGLLAFFGSSLIEKVLSIWSFALYAVYVVMIVLCLSLFGDRIAETWTVTTEGSRWFLGGLKYAAYNVGILPAMLFAVRHIETRREALSSGTLAGVIAMTPGLFIYLAMLSQYPEVVSQAIPADFVLAKLGSPVLHLLFQIILFGTFVETGVGMIHGVNERIAADLYGEASKMPGALRVGIALGILVLGIFIADAVGIVGLIAKGYGTLTWGYWIVFLIPVLTLGVWKIARSR